MLKKNLLYFVLASLFLGACGVGGNVEKDTISDENAIKFYQSLTDEEKSSLGLPQTLSGGVIADMVENVQVCCCPSFYNEFPPDTYLKHCHVSRLVTCGGSEVPIFVTNLSDCGSTQGDVGKY